MAGISQPAGKHNFPCSWCQNAVMQQDSVSAQDSAEEAMVPSPATTLPKPVLDC